jgi:hypothetical protein
MPERIPPARRATLHSPASHFRMPPFSRWIRVLAPLSVAFVATSAAPSHHAPRANAAKLPDIKHVFIIVLENKGYDTTFGPNTVATYLADSLPARGALLRQYYGIGHVSLDNYIAMISGMPPTRQTQSDCGRYADFVQTGTAPDGQPIGNGCVYPAHVLTIANQLDAKHLTWKGYMEDMGLNPAREASRCGHPVLNQLDSTERATATDQYAAKHDPFVYFHAVIDAPTCQQNVVPLTELEPALAQISTTPNYSFIAPNLCHDGHDRPCRNGEPGGLVSADAFLRHWVPIITGSPAFRKDGLLLITFDEALTLDPSACCNEPSGPNTPRPGVGGPGGGRIGAVLLSPFIKPGTVSDTPYNHYSQLRSMEDIFHLQHLGYAAPKGLVPFGDDIFGH